MRRMLQISNWHRFASAAVLSAVLFGGAVAAQTSPAVPSEYQDLFALMNNQVSGFTATVNAGWNHLPAPVLYAAQLASANAALGPQLLSTNAYAGVLLHLQELQALGARSVVMLVSFPILYPGFYQTNAEYQQYLNFYVQVANAVRARGMKLIIETQAVVPQPGMTNFDPSPYYHTLTWTQYKAARAQMAVIICQNLKPDYLSIVTEPDTEAVQTGKTEMNTVSGSTEMVNATLNSLSSNGIQGVAVGAGVGTWLSSYQSFVQSFVTTGVQFIDMHIYPINGNFLNNAINIADIAIGSGKQVAMSECWLSKERDTELSTMTYTQVFARNPYSFWTPLDIGFLQALVNFSQYKKLLFMAPFWTEYFFGNLDYNSVGGLPAQQILGQGEAVSSLAVSEGQFTVTGLGWEKMTVSGIDSMPPHAPANFAAQAGYGSINLSWSASADNVGTAGYRILRNGAQLAITSDVSYNDLALLPATTYTYSIMAFDAVGNTSSASTNAAKTLSTSDQIPPSTPTNLASHAVSTTQINLSWTTSTDNVAVSGYVLYRGISPGALRVYGSTTTNSFTDSGAGLATTYYYSVAAYDSSGNYSPQSAVVRASTLSGIISCDVNSDGMTNIVDVQMAVNQALGAAACATADVTEDGACNIIDVQRIVTSALGGSCRIGP